MSRYCSQDHILELNAVIWKIIHQIEVEVTKEIWVIFQNKQNYSYRANIESFKRFGGFLPWQHVLFQELEAANEQVFNLEPSLVLLRILSFDEVGHEVMMRNQLQPCESECWVNCWTEFLEQFSHIVQD